MYIYIHIYAYLYICASPVAEWIQWLARCDLSEYIAHIRRSRVQAHPGEHTYGPPSQAQNGYPPREWERITGSL